MGRRKAPYFPLSNQYFYLFFSVVLSFLFGWSLEVYLLTQNGYINWIFPITNRWAATGQALKPCWKPRSAQQSLCRWRLPRPGRWADPTSQHGRSISHWTFYRDQEWRQVVAWQKDSSMTGRFININKSFKELTKPSIVNLWGDLEMPQSRSLSPTHSNHHQASHINCLLASAANCLRKTQINS